MKLGESGLQAGQKIGDRESFLLHRVPMAEGDRILLTSEGTFLHAFEGFKIDRNAERSADFILTAIATSDGARLIVKDGKMFAEVLG